MKTILKNIFFAIALMPAFSSCAQQPKNENKMDTTKAQDSAKATNPSTKTETATFGAGCFWCIEAQFQMLEGVMKVESGFSGGTTKNPSYKDVCTGTTGHAEVCNIYYDTSKISYDELLAAFWQCHNPTELNRQGNDVGTQYRSVIFYHNEKQKQLAGQYKKKLTDEKVFDKPVVTEISPFASFYKAEDYHQNYYNQNGSESYCQFVVKPKVEKFQKVFKDKLKH